MIVKSTGFSLPFSYHQVFSWAQGLLWIIVFYTIILPMQSKLAMIILGLTFSVSTFYLLWYFFKVTNSNPTDPYIETYKYTKAQSSLGSSTSDNYCSLCASIVQEKSKHCMTCNRCVPDFDHHCIWINNCIGSLNYRLFFKLIVTLQIFLALKISTSLEYLVYILYNYEDYCEYYEKIYNNSSSTVSIVFVFISVVFAVVSFLLNSVLIAFHCWLYKNKTTTYKYLTSSKVSNQSEKTYEAKDRLADFNNIRNKYIQSLSNLN